MTQTKATARPPIHMIDEEADLLTNLALSVEERLPEVSQLLLDEIGRARVNTRSKVPPDVVTMNSEVIFVDDSSGTERTVTLVLPREANIDAGRVSVLTPVGAGLIGLREGQAILWPDRDGNRRALRIVKVNQAKA